MPEKNYLSSELLTRMWTGLGDRLRSGTALYTQGDFLGALCEIYEEVTGEVPPDLVRHEIGEMIASVNRQAPETYLARGVQNGISRAFEEGVRRLKWDIPKIQSSGAATMRRLCQQEGMRDLLADANLKLEHISVADCVKQVIQDVTHEGPAALRQPTRSAFRPDLAAQMQKPASMSPDKSASTAVAVDDETQALIDAGEVDGNEAKQRIESQEKRCSQLQEREMKKAYTTDRLQSYVEQGVVSADEAGKLQELDKVEQRLKKREVTPDEATRMRNSILEKGVRDKLERQVREAVANSVRYLQVFESMQKIDHSYHDAIGFLIQHKNLVVATEGADIDMSPAIKGLMEDVDLLEDVLNIMERKDQELRMISVRLHPYNGIMSRGLERIGNMTIEESFIDDLESATADEMSQRLNSNDQLQRVRPAADMRCMISLIDYVTKRTRFRKELRMLRISKQLEEFYRGTNDLKEARHQAEGFLNRRLRRMFPDMNATEAADLKQRSTEMMDQIEQRIHDERTAVVEAKRGKADSAVRRPSNDAGGDDNEELSEDEISSGVQIGRVEMRVAGNIRRIPTKIMPDPDDPELMCIASRDPETQEIVPAKRRGKKRSIQRTREGYWREGR